MPFWFRERGKKQALPARAERVLAESAQEVLRMELAAKRPYEAAQNQQPRVSRWDRKRTSLFQGTKKNEGKERAPLRQRDTKPYRPEIPLPQPRQEAPLICW